MSDFAKLLGKLQDTANTAKEAVAKNPNKRKIQDHDEEKQHISRKRRESQVIRPRDIDDLKVSVSFLCIGAQKAGTTWLHEMLRRHKGLSLPEQKEVHFWDWNRRKGLKWYSNQFSQTSRNCLCGEVTPCYAVLATEKVSEVHRWIINFRVLINFAIRP